MEIKARISARQPLHFGNRVEVANALGQHFAETVGIFNRSLNGKSPWVSLTAPLSSTRHRRKE